MKEGEQRLGGEERKRGEREWESLSRKFGLHYESVRKREKVRDKTK